MSEFTDFHALQTDAATLGALRGMLVEHVGGADVPLDELGVDFTEGLHVVEDAWTKAPKPLWIKLGITGTVDDLAKLGPAVHIRVEEDFSSWALDARCGGASFTGAVLLEQEMYREATDGVPLYDPAASGDALAGVATCLGLDAGQLHATLQPDGGEAFSAAVGIEYEQMLDTTLDEITPGEVVFSFLY